jgi:prepilin-type N-terminal cleavage/methylation domain-containing protein
LQARRRVRGQDGFTLIEVLIAMVILAVGLLGLEALGIGAARLVGRAERQGDYINAASTRLEATMAPAPPDGRPHPARGCRPSDSRRAAAHAVRGNGRLWTVTVTVTPTDSAHQKDTYVLSGNVFR